MQRIVTPAKAAVQGGNVERIPASAGMTNKGQIER
jgi:hypothetical protein